MRRTVAIALAALVMLGGAVVLGRLINSRSGDEPATSTPTDEDDDEGPSRIDQGAGGTLDRNVVVINTDDLPTSLFPYLPKTQRLLAPSAIEFTNHIVSTSTCCPSRASLFSGLEPQNHGVINNVQPFGSATRFDHDQSFVISLHEAGYATAHYGKYLNGFRAAQPLVPEGWDDFHALIFDDSPTRGFFDYTILENGETVRYGLEPKVYSTRLLGERAVDFIETNAGNRSFFVYYAPFAPHIPATAEAAYDGSLDDLEVVRPPNFNEEDVADKPRWVQETDPIPVERAAEIDQQYRDMAESLATVDDMVEEIVLSLEEAGVLDRTLIVFTSDNGVLLGAHRQTAKECPYEECIRTPLLIYQPDATVVGQSSALVSPADYAPTILDWLGVEPGWKMDGFSLLGAFADADWFAREAKLIQVLGRPFNQNRNFIGLRTETHTYVEYRTGERELYDLGSDPYQLENVIDDPARAELIEGLARALDERRSATDLRLAFEIENPQVARGDEIELAFTVTNDGPHMANQVYVVYRTPDAVRAIDCSGSDEARCYSFGRLQQIRLMAVDPGASVTGTVRLVVRDGASVGAVPFDVALEPFNTVDPNPANDVVRFELFIS